MLPYLNRHPLPVLTHLQLIVIVCMLLITNQVVVSSTITSCPLHVPILLHFLHLHLLISYTPQTTINVEHNPEIFHQDKSSNLVTNPHELVFYVLIFLRSISP